MKKPPPYFKARSGHAVDMGKGVFMATPYRSAKSTPVLITDNRERPISAADKAIAKSVAAQVVCTLKSLLNLNGLTEYTILRDGFKITFRGLEVEMRKRH